MGYLVTLIVGVGLVLTGIVVLIVLPQRRGGTVKGFSVEVSAPGAGLVLVMVGVAAMGWSAPQVQFGTGRDGSEVRPENAASNQATAVLQAQSTITRAAPTITPTLQT